MKRVNPVTMVPFKRGDRHEMVDKIFWKYRKNIKDGFYQEQWIDPDKYIQWKQNDNRSGSSRTIQGIATNLLNYAMKRAKRKGAICTLNQQWILEQIQNGCSVTGLAFEIPARGSQYTSARAPSLDRIDSNNPNYTIDNTRVVCYQVNMAKNRFTDQESFQVLSRYVQYLQGLQNE